MNRNRISWHVSIVNEPIPFIDLKSQTERLRKKLDASIQGVLDHGKFVLGPEVSELEERLAEFSGAKHAITCANGTDALQIALMALGVGRGDAVFVPSFTFAASGEAPALVGATPIFIDVEEGSFNLDILSLEAALAVAKAQGLRPAAVIAVDLFGQPADYDAISALAEKYRLTVIADAAQSFGATLNGRRVGTLAPITTTSFFPAKPLGCYGDGGALFTDDDKIAALLRSIRVHGAGTERYDNVRIGINSRLDTLQAAILLHKLEIFPDEIAARDRVARRYSEALVRVAIVPTVKKGRTSVWAQYTLRLPGADRNAVADALKAKGIPTAVYYPLPLHRQTAFLPYPRVEALPVSERLANEVLSLPMHPYLKEETQARIVAAMKEAIGTRT